jgi:two-component system CheB/CheR fusion protein
MRVRPYRTHEHKIDGAVIMLVDVDELRAALAEARDAQEYADAVVTTVREPLVVLDEKLQVLRANRGFYEAFKVSPEQTEGRLLFDIGERQWDIPRLRELLEQVVPLHTTFDDFQVAHDFPGRFADDAAQRPRIEDGSSRKPHPARDRGRDRPPASEAERARRLSIAGARGPRRKDSAISCSASDDHRHVPLKLSFDDLLREILERVRQTLDGDTAVILLRKLHEADEEDDGAVLYARAAIGLDEETRERVGVPIGSGFAGRVAAEQRPVILDEVDYSQVVSPYIRELVSARSSVCRCSPKGTSRRPPRREFQPRKFGQKDAEILMLAAGASRTPSGGGAPRVSTAPVPPRKRQSREGRVPRAAQP